MTTTLESIERYTAKHGIDRTTRLLSSLGKDKRFISAWESEVGKELMGKLLSMADDRLDSIIQEKADEKIRAEYRVCMELLLYFKRRINLFYKNQEALDRG